MLGHANAVAWVRIWVSSWRGSISVIRCTFPRLVDSSCTRRSTSFAISAVSGAPAHSTTWYSLGSSRTAQEVRQALLAGDAADEHDRGGLGVDAAGGQGGGLPVRRPLVDVDAVVDHVDRRGIDRRVGPQDVLAHTHGDRDDACGALVGRALGEGADGVSAAELLGLPRP